MVVCFHNGLSLFLANCFRVLAPTLFCIFMVLLKGTWIFLCQLNNISYLSFRMHELWNWGFTSEFKILQGCRSQGVVGDICNQDDFTELRLEIFHVMSLCRAWHKIHHLEVVWSSLLILSLWQLHRQGFLLNWTWVCLPATQQSQSTDTRLWWRKVQCLFAGHQARRVGSSCSKDHSSQMAFREEFKGNIWGCSSWTFF